MSPSFDLQLERERFAPGETVEGTVLVTEGGEARALELALEFREKSPDYEETAARIAAMLHSGDVSAGQSFPFSLALPPDALPAYTSSHGELWWQLDLKCDEPRGRDEHVRRRIDVTAA